MTDSFWQQLKHEAEQVVAAEPLLASYIHACILNHHNFESALSFILCNKIQDQVMPAVAVREMFDTAYLMQPDMAEAAVADMQAVLDRDPAITSYFSVLLNLKGFQAIQVHRLAHYLWNQERQSLARFIQSRNSEVMGVDIHPAANIGKGVMFDHATGIVVGETCVIEDNVSLLQGVTLGGTGNEHGDRHPKVREGVMIGAGAKVLGNIEVGCGSRVGAGSVVLSDVPSQTTVVGVPAKVVNVPCCAKPCESMDQMVVGASDK